jgi:hypothetical protein
MKVHYRPHHAGHEAKRNHSYQYTTVPVMIKRKQILAFSKRKAPREQEKKILSSSSKYRRHHSYHAHSSEINQRRGKKKEATAPFAVHLDFSDANLRKLQLQELHLPPACSSTIYSIF